MVWKTYRVRESSGAVARREDEKEKVDGRLRTDAGSGGRGLVLNGNKRLPVLLVA